MAKSRGPRAVYACQQCGAQQPRWMGKCPDCGEWAVDPDQLELCIARSECVDDFFALVASMSESGSLDYGDDGCRSDA